MTGIQEKIVKPKPRLLELAKRLGGVLLARNAMGCSRAGFYRFKALHQQGGAEALIGPRPQETPPGRSRTCGRTSIRGQPRGNERRPHSGRYRYERRLCGLSEKRDISRSRKGSKPTNQSDSAQPILGIAGRGVRHIKSEVLQINTSTQRTVISKLPHSSDRRVTLQRATRMGFTPRPAC